MYFYGQYVDPILFAAIKILFIVITILYFIASVCAIWLSVNIAKDKGWGSTTVSVLLWVIGLFAPLGWIGSSIIAGALSDRRAQTNAVSTSVANDELPEI